LGTEAHGILLRKDLGLVDERVVQNVEVIFKGHRARRLQLTGRHGGQPIRLRVTFFPYEGSMVEIIAWRPAAANAADATVGLDRVEVAFTLLPPSARARSTSPARAAAKTADAPAEIVGADWAVEYGAFESAPFGCRLRPLPGWRLVTGRALAAENPDAFVGLRHEDPSIRLLILAEIARGESRDPLVEALARDTATRLGGKEALPAVEAKFLGGAISLARFRPPADDGLEYLHGVASRGAVVYQVLAWYGIAAGTKAPALVRQVLARLEELGEDAVRTLTARLEAGAAGRVAVGPDFALRGGRYVDFALGFVWGRPARGLWRVWTGADAALRDPDARLLVVAPSAGARVRLVAEPSMGLPSRVYHQGVARLIWGAKSAQATEVPEEIRVGGAKAWRSRGRVPGTAPTSWVDLTTLLHRGTAFQIVAEGLEGNRDGVGRARDGVLAGFTFPAQGIEPSRRTKAA
ncbi:MAG: hypothetical protein ACC662_03825, partial [Planctomycetota bacterium]